MEKLRPNLKTRYSPVQLDGIWHQFITIWSTVFLQGACQKTSRNISIGVKLESMYMDGTMDSVTDDKTGIKLYHELSKLWLSAGMYARK